VSPLEIIQHFHLQPHPEGGWYRETYRCNEQISAAVLPERFNGDRSFSTAIYFLLEQGNFSAFHKIKSDECWHFYAGDPLEVYMIQDRECKVVTLGNGIEEGQVFQYVVPANSWFASRPAAESKFSFVGCTVAPGFDFADFEMADAKELLAAYPEHKIIIKELSR
jgi:predicted cupin superfamily sugar epimerase